MYLESIVNCCPFRQLLSISSTAVHFVNCCPFRQLLSISSTAVHFVNYCPFRQLLSIGGQEFWTVAIYFTLLTSDNSYPQPLMNVINTADDVRTNQKDPPPNCRLRWVFYVLASWSNSNANSYNTYDKVVHK